MTQQLILLLGFSPVNRPYNPPIYHEGQDYRNLKLPVVAGLGQDFIFIRVYLCNCDSQFIFLVYFQVRTDTFH